MIELTGPGDNALDFDTTVKVESVLFKFGYAAEIVLAEITLGAHIDDAVAPEMVAVLPAEGLVTLAANETFVMSVQASDLNLYSLEVDHSFEGTLPEFSVYASEATPWGTDADKAMFDAAGVTISYDADLQKWTIDFGEDITDTYFIPSGVTFYMVLKDEAENAWGSMDPTTAENTFAYTFEVTNTLESEITSALTYEYDPVYDYVGDIDFNDSNNIFTATYSPVDFIAEGAMNDLARYLGALYRQDTSTVISITFNSVEYTWDETGTLKGSNWEDPSGNTLVSAMVTEYLAGPKDLVVAVSDGWHTSNVTFRLLITNTLDEEIESAPSYVYDPVYTYVGSYAFEDLTNIYTVTYDDVEFNPNSMNDLARYLGALYRQVDATVTSIVYGGVTYTWDETGTLLGSNWEDDSGKTLISQVVDDFEDGLIDPAIGLVFTVSDGVHTETVTFKFVILDTIAPLLTITGATADGDPMAGDLATGYILETTNDPAVDHLLQIAATADEALADEYFGLHFVEAESTVTAAELKAYYDARGVPEPYLAYLKAAADGTNPFVYIKEGALSLSLVDAAKHDIQATDVDMTIPDDFPEGTYVVRGSISDSAGNTTVVTLKLIVLRTLEVTDADLKTSTEKLGPYADLPGSFVDGFMMILDPVEDWYYFDTDMITSNRMLADGSYPFYLEGTTTEVFTLVVSGEGTEFFLRDTYANDGTPLRVQGNFALGTYTYVGEVEDEYNLTDEVSITITFNDMPVATAQSVTVLEDTPMVITLAGVDTFPGTLTYIVTSEPLHGTLSGSVPTLTHTPALNYFGTDSFTFKVSDGLVESTAAIVSITVTPVNDEPNAVDDFYSVDEDGTLSVAAPGVMLNDVDFDPDIMTVTLITDVTNGVLTLLADGSFVYQPDPNFNGTDTFIYELVTYPGILSEWTDQALVTITINPVNDVPVLDPIGNKTIDELSILTFTAEASDIGLPSQALSYSLAGAPTGASIDPVTGIFSWTPNETQGPGSYSFDVCVSDGTDDDCETIIVTVNEVNQSPVIGTIGNKSVVELTELTFTATASDSDIPVQLLVFNLVGAPDGAAIVPATGVFTWTPDVTQLPGDYTFQVCVSDGLLQDCEEITVTVIAGLSVTEVDLLMSKDPATLETTATPVPGNLADGFTMYLDSSVAWYYLDTDTIVTNHPLADGSYPFYLSPNTTIPIFYLKVQGTTYTLIDAYQGDPSPLRINGDFAPGTYTYTGELTDILGSSADVSIDITFIDALAWLQANTVLSSVSMMVDDLTATFPASIPPVIVAEDYVIDSRMTLAAALPIGTTVTVYKDGVAVLTDITLVGTGPFWFTQLFDPDAPRADFDANYGGAVEEYSIVVTGPGGNPLDFDTTVFIESVISKDDFATETVLDDITLGIHIDDAVAPSIASGVAKSVSHGDVALIEGKFTVNQGYVVDTIELTMDEAVLVELGTIVTMVGYGPYGTVTAHDGALITITPYTGYEIAALIGTFTFTVPEGAVTDLRGNEFVGSIALDVLNVAPVAEDDAYSTIEDALLNVPSRGVLSNDSDFDPSVLTAAVVTEPANGTLTLSADGSFTYTPDLNYFGTDSFTYKADDGITESNIATVTIMVTPVNDAPIAVDDEYEVDEDEHLLIPAPGVLANDIEVDPDNMTVTLITDVLYGSLSLVADGAFTYLPDPDFYGTDTFVYELVTYPGTLSEWTDQATVTIYVNPINDAPVAVDDVYSTDEDTTLNGSTVLANDSDVDGDSLTAELVSTTTHGALTLVADGTFTYEPEEDFNGEDSFTYKAFDGEEYSTVAIVTITVHPVNDAPVAVDDIYELDEDEMLVVEAPGVLANDYDIEGDSLTVDLVQNVSHGTLVLNADGSFTYTPYPDFSGVDTFTYEACDAMVCSPVATVTITVGYVNDWPVANDDAYETTSGVTLIVDAENGVLANDVLIDPEEIVSLEVLVQPLHGILLFDTEDGSFTYTPNSGFFGIDTFEYELRSELAISGEWSDTALVTITIKPFATIYLPMIFK